MKKLVHLIISISILLLLFAMPSFAQDGNDEDAGGGSNAQNQNSNDLSEDENSENNNEQNTDERKYEYPVFVQKGGMMETGDHALYLRSNDEWTGFSTFYLGYRYAVNDFFNFSIEGGVSAIIHVYLAGIQLHFKFYESPDYSIFIGNRTRFGYKYQDVDFNRWTSPGDGLYDYLTVKRNGIYAATDFTISFRLGHTKRHSLYYSIYPRIDIDFVDAGNRVIFMFSPIMFGYEFRFGKDYRWNVAVEAGYTFPIPWDHIDSVMWPNFPSLANFILQYRW